MKNIPLTIFTLITFTLTAQQAITVTASDESSADSKQYFTVDIPQVTLKDVAKDWQQYTDKNKGKTTNTGGTYTQTEAVNTNISPNPFTLYSTLTETTAGVRVTLWLTESNPASTTGPAKSNRDLAVKKYLHDFATAEYREVVKAELKNEQNKLAAMEKELTVIIKSGEKSNKTITSNERSNQRAEDAIVTNNSDIKTSDRKITDQKGMVEQTAADPNATKGAEKTLGEMEKDKKELQKKNEVQNKSIDSRDKESRIEDRNMMTSQDNQERKTAAIEKQKETVRKVQAKLDGIR